MKKLLFLALALLLTLALVSCGEEEKQETVGMANPMVSYETLAQINEKVGVNMMKPGVMGVSDEAFFVVGETVAQYNFKVAGYNYTFRAANQKEDISGVWVDGKTVFDGNTEPFKIVTSETSKSCQFFVGDTQYVVTVDDEGKMEESNFEAICDELKTTVEMKTGK